MTAHNPKSTRRRRSGGEGPQWPPQEVVDRFGGPVVARGALEEALEGLGPEQVVGRLAGRVIETALGAELTGHLGYPPGQAPLGGGSDTRNGSTPKTVQTDLAPSRSRRHATVTGRSIHSWWPSARTRPAGRPG